MNQLLQNLAKSLGQEHGPTDHVKQEISPMLWRLGVLTAVTVAAGLRLYELGFQSLWLNELDSWWISHREDVGVILRREAMSDPHPPGYNLLLQVVIQWFGDSEIVLRAPSVLSGVLAVYFIALLGRRLFDPATGLMAALLMAVLWAPIYYAQDARAYSTLMLMTILSTYLLVVICDQTEKSGRASWSTRFGYAAATAAVIYLHYFGMLILALHAVLFVMRIGLTRQVMALLIGVSVLYLPWLPSTIEDLQITHWIREPGLGHIHLFLYFCFNKSRELYLFVALPLQAWACGKAVLTWAQSDDRAKAWRKDPTFLVVLWITIPMFIALAKSLLSQPVWNDRNLLICAPALYLLTARGVALLPSMFRVRQTAAAVVVLLAVLHLTVFMGYYSTPTKGDFRAVVKHVLDSGDLTRYPVIGTRHAHYYDYYFKHFGSDIRTSLVVTSLVAMTDDDRERLEVFVDSAPDRSFWLLQAGVVAKPRGELQEILDSRHLIVDQASPPNGKATLFRARDVVVD